jgi:hypothetical protein
MFLIYTLRTPYAVQRSASRRQYLARALQKYFQLQPTKNHGNTRVLRARVRQGNVPIEIVKQTLATHHRQRESGSTVHVNEHACAAACDLVGCI